MVEAVISMVEVIPWVGELLTSYAYLTLALVIACIVGQVGRWDSEGE